MPEATLLLGAALGIFLLIAIVLMSIFNRTSRKRDRGDDGAWAAGTTGASDHPGASPASGGWWSGGEAGGGDAGGGDGGGGGGGGD